MIQYAYTHNKTFVVFNFAASGLKHGFVLLQNSRYQQFVGAYTLTAADETSKVSLLKNNYLFTKF